MSVLILVEQSVKTVRTRMDKGGIVMYTLHRCLGKGKRYSLINGAESDGARKWKDRFNSCSLKPRSVALPPR